jgi:hypothetical protein
MPPGAIEKTLNTIPAPVMRHLTILWSAKEILADILLHRGNYDADSETGAGMAFDAVLRQIQAETAELVKLRTHDGRTQDGMRLKRSLFRPLKGISLTPWQARVYQAALHTAELQLRRLHDSSYVFPEHFTREV